MQRAPLFLIALAIALIIALTAAACATSSPDHANPRDEHSILHVVATNLHYRRPEGRPADPQAYYWEKEFKSDPLPGAGFDCAPIPSLYGKLPFAEIRGCLQSLQSATPAVYRLERGALPELVLDTEDKETTPKCLARLLAKIPVPREIFFQSPDEGRMNCYSSRVEDNAGLVADLGPLLRSNKLALRISFPLDRLPKNDPETLWLIESWTLAPFRGEGGRIFSRIMPDSLCDRCLGEKNRVKAWEGIPKTWPDQEEAPGLTQ